MNRFREQLKGLDQLVSQQLRGTAVHLHPIPGEVPVVQVSVEGREEQPIFVTASNSQLLCICHLWRDDEVKPECRAELMEAMLDLNLRVPLSAFGRVDGRFVLFGALATDARVEDIATEVAVLSDNAADAIDALAEFVL